MARGKGSRVSYGWTAKRFSSDVPPGKRQLAKALQEVCRHLSPGDRAGTGPTQAEAALHVNVSETSLSRFLSGRSVPRLETLKHIYKTASADAGGEDRITISKARLMELHERANADHCHSCVTLRAETEALREQLRDAADEIARAEETAQAASRDADRLRREVAALQQAVRRLKETVASLTANPAGLEVRRAVRPVATSPLPVPRRGGDRQRSARDKAAAQNVARRADELRSGSRQENAVPLLRHTTEALSHAEIAALLCLLRQQRQAELADNLIHMYGRDRSHQDVVHVAMELHRHGAQEDAGALLRVRATLE
ncbi:hypothetical protein AB0L74_04055 [Streptomyces sp. NPDC052020]|uniref:helix-turn-helix domain-containing protein n=1 Tax=Streptomyces sp. NPDC052020 TaxID=3155677 RepID=UPI0034232B57